LIVGEFYSENTMRKARSKGTVLTRRQSKAKARDQTEAFSDPKESLFVTEGVPRGSDARCARPRGHVGQPHAP